jgi:disulfide bond formation protein DsbB
MLGSLYFSDVVGFIPCLLCWYQRIAMYPIVFVLGVGLLKRDPTAWRFALPLPLLGLVISLYHVALQYRPNLEILSCEIGVPCSARYVAVFGFVSIPVLAAAAFLLIAVLLFTVRTVQLGSADESPPVASSDAP